MTGNPEHDDIQRDLSALLAEVQPSAGFAAGVRARIAADERNRRRAWMSWAMPVTAGLLIGFVSWTMVSRRSSSPAPAVDATAWTSAAVGIVSPPVTPAVAKPGTAASNAARETAVVQASVAHEPEVLVPDDQMTAVVHYLDRLNAGGAPALPAVGPQYDGDGLLLRPAPLVITPLPPLTAFPDDDRNVKPDGKGSGQE